MLKNFAFGCMGALLGLVVGILLTFGVLSLWPRTAAPEKVASVTASRGDVTITVSAQYLNAQLQQIAKQTGAAKQATLTLATPNLAQIVVAVDTKILGQTFSGNATVRLRVAVHNGRVAFTVEKIDLNSLGVSPSLVAPIVEQIRAQAEDQLNRAIQHELQGTGLRLSNLRVAPNELAIDLTMQ